MMVLITGMCGRCAQIQTPLSDYSPLSFNCALIHNRSWKALLLLSMKGATVWGLYRREHPIRFLLSWKSQIPPCECWRGADQPAFSLKPERTNTPPPPNKSINWWVCEARMLMKLESKIFLLWCLEHCVSTTSVSILQRMHYSPVVRWITVVKSWNSQYHVYYDVITPVLYVTIREDLFGEELCSW